MNRVHIRSSASQEQPLPQKASESQIAVAKDMLRGCVMVWLCRP